MRSLSWTAHSVATTTTKLRAAIAGTGVALALAFSAGAADQAHAGYDYFCPTPPTSTGYRQLAAGSVCYGPNHSLRAVVAVTNESGRKVQAGAYWSGGGMYAGWAEAFGNACHSYSGGNELQGAISHPHSVPVSMYGYQRWGSEAAC